MKQNIIVSVFAILFILACGSFFADAANAETAKTETDKQTERNVPDTATKSIIQGYIDSISKPGKGGLDFIILGSGVIFFIWEVYFLVCFLGRQYWATQYSKIILELNSGICEVFPLLGLLGTVLGLLNTFSALGAGGKLNESVLTTLLSTEFAPALTTTVSGMLALIPTLVLCVITWFLTQYVTQEGK